jgi:hypothetical protein
VTRPAYCGKVNRRSEAHVKTRDLVLRLTLAVSVLAWLPATARAVEPEKQPIYTNIVGGLLCGTAVNNQCTVPAGRRLIIEYVSGFVFQPLSSRMTISISMAVTDNQGLNGASFHQFVAAKTNTTTQRDVFVFSTPFRMMLGPQSKFYFSGAAGLAVSGYLVNSP